MSDKAPVPRKDQYADDKTYNENLRSTAEKLGVLKDADDKKKVENTIADTTNKERE